MANIVKRKYTEQYVKTLQQEIKTLKYWAREAKAAEKKAEETLDEFMFSGYYYKCPRCGSISYTEECTDCGYDYDYWECPEN